jgi:ABC-2 type transport system ATP-binding protein
MILKRGDVVITGTMNDLRDKFGSLRYEVWYLLEDEKVASLQVLAEKSGNIWMTTVKSVSDLNSLTSEITRIGGVVERIESKYPSLEEILVKVGK